MSPIYNWLTIFISSANYFAETCVTFLIDQITYRIIFKKSICCYLHNDTRPIFVEYPFKMLFNYFTILFTFSGLQETPFAPTHTKFVSFTSVFGKTFVYFRALSDELYVCFNFRWNAIQCCFNILYIAL